MKPETVRIPVMTSPCSACVPAFVGANWDGCHRVLRTDHGVGLDGCRHHYNARVRGCGTHLSGSGCAGACGDVPLWRHQTRTFAAAHSGL
jgi:hypothetical protein